jgi:hypothetical protein
MNEGRNKAPRRIRSQFSTLELVSKDIQSMKLAWRNKISHAANHPAVMKEIRRQDTYPPELLQ